MILVATIALGLTIVMIGVEIRSRCTLDRVRHHIARNLAEQPQSASTTKDRGNLAGTIVGLMLWAEDLHRCRRVSPRADVDDLNFLRRDQIHLTGRT